MNPSLNELMRDFQELHQHEKNLLAHKIGIPAVLFGTLILLSWISISIGGKFHIAFSWLASAALLAYYYRINVKIGGAMTALLGVLTLLAVWVGYPHPTAFNLIVFLLFFLGGFGVLLYGHSFEKSGMKFNLQLCHFVGAPLFLTVLIIQALKLENYFDLPSANPDTKSKP